MLELWLQEPIAYALAAVLFVLIPAIMEPDESFSAAADFYGTGVLLIVWAYGGSGLLGLWQQGLIIFPPIVAGLACVFVIGRVRGYGGAVRFFSLPENLTRTERTWLVLRRVLVFPLVLIAVSVMAKVAPATEDWIYSLCPPGNFIENDSEPAYCLNPRIETLVVLNGYTVFPVGILLAVVLVALLEPVHKVLASRLVWLVGSGFLALLAPLSLLESARFLLVPVVTFAVGAFCVWVVGRIYPEPSLGLEPDLSR